jgi:hypothetical protein
MEIVMKSVIKTAEMLVQFDDQEDAQLVSATLALDEGEDTVAEAIATIALVLGTNPTWARYEMGRIRIFETLENAGKTEDAIKQKWLRIRRETGMVIPESDDPEAKRKAEQRAKARAVFAEKSNNDLQTEMAQLLANPTIAKLESAKKISKELATRQNDLGKNAKSELVELRKQVKSEIDSIEDMELLADLLAQLRS